MRIFATLPEAAGDRGILLVAGGAALEKCLLQLREPGPGDSGDVAVLDRHSAVLIVAATRLSTEVVDPRARGGVVDDRMRGVVLVDDDIGFGVVDRGDERKGDAGVLGEATSGGFAATDCRDFAFEYFVLLEGNTVAELVGVGQLEVDFHVHVVIAESVLKQLFVGLFRFDHGVGNIVVGDVVAVLVAVCAEVMGDVGVE
ncbi:hypothetical protein, partial [Nocardia sp. NPDC004604]|uniref:hypothetical protein n=1 Tax=Nocardia sp. NPDC004604 TaxID=3157013 RepID=UPI0033A7E132